MSNESIFRISPVSTSANTPLIRKIEKRYSQREGAREEEFKELLEGNTKENENKSKKEQEDKTKKTSSNLLNNLDIASRIYIDISNSNGKEDDK